MDEDMYSQVEIQTHRDSQGSDSIWENIEVIFRKS